MNSDEITKIVQHHQKHLRKLDHPNIGKLYESKVITNDPNFSALMVMEYLEGHNLYEFKIRWKSPENIYRRIIKDLLSAVEYCHSKKVIHQDIKASNIMVCKDKKGNYVIKLVDFDMSAKKNGFLKTKKTIGTEDYRAPELFKVEFDSDYK